MQEQINEKSASLIISGSKMTGRVLAKAMSKFLSAQKQKEKGMKPETYRGKQTLRKLAGQDAGMSNIEITEGNIKSFDKYARKYGVDYALKRDKVNNKWLQAAENSSRKPVNKQTAKKQTNQPQKQSLNERLKDAEKQVKGYTPKKTTGTKKQDREAI